MKKLFAILFTFTLVAAFAGCDNHPVINPDGTAVSPAETEYPTGQVQNEMVMYNGHIFIHGGNGFERILPADCTLVGKVQSVSNENLPRVDFSACHLEIGQEIYANPSVGDTIYVKYSKGYALFRAESAIDITASVKNVTRTGLTLVLDYVGEPCDAEFYTGSQFHLEKYTNGSFIRLGTLEPEEEYVWTAIAYIIPCTDDPSIIGSAEIETNWAHMYGTLTDGRYRVVKEISECNDAGDTASHTVYAEFVIDETIE